MLMPDMAAKSMMSREPLRRCRSQTMIPQSELGDQEDDERDFSSSDDEPSCPPHSQGHSLTITTSLDAGPRPPPIPQRGNTGSPV